MPSAQDCYGTTGDAMKYNALGVIGLETNDGDNVLCLGGAPSDDCPNGAEYNACPQTWILNHLADGADDTFIDRPRGLQSGAIADPLTGKPLGSSMTLTRR